MRALRPDQTSAIDNLRQAMMEGDRRIVMQAPTGFGKTLLAAEVVASARRKSKRVLFTVPMISLVDQTVEMFWQHGINEIGVMQANHRMRNPSMPVQVASVQTLTKRDMPDSDVIVIDEVHKWFQAYENWMKEELSGDWVKQPIIGLSATPWSKRLGVFFTKLIKASTTAELIEQGLLSDFRVFAPSKPDLSGIRTTGGDYQQDELSARMRQVKLVADIVETWLEHGRGRPTICFCVDRLHAQRVKEMFDERGVKTAYQDMKTTMLQRAEIKRGFHAGEIEVVCNVGTLTTGVDWDVRCIILARPTKSEMLFVQMVGRGLRTANGKDHCLILDHSYNHLKLGFVTDVDEAHNELAKGSSALPAVTDRIRLPKECPACSYLKPPGVAVCPACGFKAQAHCKIEPTKGELKEIERKKKEARKAENIDKEMFYGELLGYAEMHGYVRGWAANQYREKLGVWPDRMKHVQPVFDISQMTSGWIKSRQIAWARSRRRFQ